MGSGRAKEGFIELHDHVSDLTLHQSTSRYINILCLNLEQGFQTTFDAVAGD